MSDPLAAAREALARFDASTREIVARRLSYQRASAPMNRFMPDATAHLRAALARVDELEAMANGGYRALLADCDGTIDTALRAVEIGAFPGPAWRDRAAGLRKLIAEVTRGE